MPYALITGASKGIGEAIATELAKRKINLVLTARSENLLRQLAGKLQSQYGIHVKYIALDLSKEETIDAIKNFVIAEDIDLQILVNNAGYGLWGNFESISLRKQVSMLRLNNENLISLTYALLPYLHRQKQSYILNVASTTAYQAVPFMAVYAASKSFVVSFSRGLASELANSNVSVTCLSPGATSTSFIDNAGMAGQKKIVNAAEKVSMTADDVARIAINALFAKEREVIPGFINKLTAYANNFLPKRLIEGIAAGIYKTE